MSQGINRIESAPSQIKFGSSGIISIGIIVACSSRCTNSVEILDPDFIQAEGV